MRTLSCFSPSAWGRGVGFEKAHVSRRIGLKKPTPCLCCLFDILATE